jgi:hypothetical protein
MESKRWVRSLFDFSIYRIRLTTVAIKKIPITSGTKKEGFSISTKASKSESPTIRITRRNMLM